MRNFIGISATALFVACLSASPASAQLDGILDIDTDDGLNVNVLDDTANVRLGGGDSNVVDADVGDGLVEADVNTRDGVNANVRALDDTVEADVSVGGSRGLVDADVNIGGDDDDDDDDDDDNNNNDDDDDDNNNDNDDDNDNNNNGNNGNNGGAGSNRSASLGNGISCLDSSSPIFGQLASINYSTSAVARWANASNVQFIPVSVCTGLDGQLGSGLFAYVAPSIPALQMALSSSSYSASDVLGVIQSGSTLNVYVD